MRALTIAVALVACASPAAAQCTVRGVASLDGARLDARVDPPFEVSLREQPLAVELAPDRSAFRSTGAFAFTGTVPSDGLAFALARPTRVGPLRLRPGTPLAEVRAAGPHARGVAELTLGVRARVDLPCRALRLGPTAEPPDAVPEDAPTHGALLANAGRLRVHTAPAGPSSVELELDEPTRLAELARRDGWVRVRRDFFDGATLDGWVRARDVRRVEPVELTESMMGTHRGIAGGCISGASHTYTGPATVRAGARVRVAPDGEAWARARRDVELRVRWSWGAEWVRLLDVDGVVLECTDPARAWVPRAQVVLPERE